MGHMGVLHDFDDRPLWLSLGTTHTMLPATGSPLLVAGSACPPLDQRGNNRNRSACDIGAVEVA